MLTIDEAVAHILATVRPTGTERVALGDSLDRVVAQVVTAPVALPPWNNSAMDGYAVVAADTSGATREQPVGLKVVGTAPAGGVFEGRLEPGQAVVIATGAPMPPGADAVVLVEDSDGAREGVVHLFEAAREGQHVPGKGAAAPAGGGVAEPGDGLTPGRLALLAAVGVVSVQVARAPRVGILSTGDEVIRPGLPLGPGQIYSSNDTALAALVRRAGGVPVVHEASADDPEELLGRMRGMLAMKPDLLVTTGGVSVGPFDFVRDVMAELGAEMDFWKVRMKPGKPLAFGTVDGVPLFGLPGNPVSCMVNFLQFVRPWMRRAMGDPHPFLPVLDAVAAEDFHDRPGRARLLRVTLHAGPKGWLARSTGIQSSGAVVSMAMAQGLLLVPADEEAPRAGDAVRVQLIEAGSLQRPDAGYPW